MTVNAGEGLGPYQDPNGSAVPSLVTELNSQLQAAGVIVERQPALDTEHAFRDVRTLVAEFLVTDIWDGITSTSMMYALAPDMFQRPMNAALSFVTSGSKEDLRELTDALLEFSGSFLMRYLQALQGLINRAPSSTDVRPLRDVRNRIAEGQARLAALQTLERIRSASERAEGLTDEVVAVTTTLGENVTEKGAIELSNFYSTHGGKQKGLAFWWTLGCMAIFGAIGAGGIVLFLSVSDDGVTWTDALHYLVALPFVVVAVYAGRIASLHRHRADWALTAAVQLQTIREYSAFLPKDEQMRLRFEFGQRVFGPPGGETANVAPPNLLEESKSTIEQLKSVVATLTDAVKAIRPGA